MGDHADLLVGYLIARSTFLPRIIGLLMILAALGYVTYLSEPLGKALSPFDLVSAAPGELSLLLWLLVKRVNVRRWQESAGVGQTGGATTAAHRTAAVADPLHRKELAVIGDAGLGAALALPEAAG